MARLQPPTFRQGKYNARLIGNQVKVKDVMQVQVGKKLYIAVELQQIIVHNFKAD